MINQVWLKTFCTLVDVGHFTQTADKLFMTQSGVSQHIKKLESQLDAALILREGKSFSLTDAGRLLHQKGQELLRNAEELEHLILQDEAHKGQVKIASPGSVGLQLYPYLLDIQKTHSNLIIDYIFAPNRTIEEDLSDRKIDLGLMTELSKDSRVVSQKIADEPLVLVTPCYVESVDWQSLIKLGFISHPDAAHHANLLLSENFSEFAHADQFPHKGFSNQISLILEPISRGLGFTVLPLYAAKAFHSQNLVKMHMLKQPVSESLYLCVNRQSTLANRTKFIKSSIINYLD